MGWTSSCHKSAGSQHTRQGEQLIARQAQLMSLIEQLGGGPSWGERGKIYRESRSQGLAYGRRARPQYRGHRGQFDPRRVCSDTGGRGDSRVSRARRDHDRGSGRHFSRACPEVGRRTAGSSCRHCAPLLKSLRDLAGSVGGLITPEMHLAILCSNSLVCASGRNGCRDRCCTNA